VIDLHHWYEYIGVVAILANVRSLNVRQILANGIHAVMAINTISSDVQVIEIGRQPAHSAVTVIAVVATGYMRRVFAERSHAIMA